MQRLRGMLFIGLMVSITVSGWSQGLGLGTASPTEILHLYRDQNLSSGDVAIRHQTQASGTGGIGIGPSSGTSSSVAGADLPWTNPTNADATDDAYATFTLGSSNLLYSNIGFTVPGGATINSVDIEVEKSYSNNPVSQLDAWAGISHSNNNTTYNFNYNVSPGTSRVLVVCVFQNNDNNANETLNGVTYGTIGLTNRGVIQNGNNDDHTLEIWTLNEADIALAAGTSLAFTWSGQVRDAQFYYAGSFQYVDQSNPFSASAINTADDVSTLQLSAPLAVNNGDMVISTAGFGNDKRILTAPTGYSVQIEQEFSSGPDGSFTVSTKAITASGTEQPTTKYAAGIEDMSVAGLVLNNGFGITTEDVVSLYDGTNTIGANLAVGAAWTTSDTYASYSGTATEAQINGAGFGAVVSATVTGAFCTAQIDHVRITISYTTTPGVFTEFTTGLDQSSGNYVISQSSALGTSDVMRMSTGSILFSVAAGTFSDYRYKKHIKPLSSSLNKLTKLQGVSYEMRIKEFPGIAFPTGRQIGFIAQDMEKVFPELVKTDEKGFKSVTYSTITPVLVEAIKELNMKIEALEADNKELTAELAKYSSIEQEVADIKKELNRIILNMNSNYSAKK